MIEWVTIRTAILKNKKAAKHHEELPQWRPYHSLECITSGSHNCTHDFRFNFLTPSNSSQAFSLRVLSKEYQRVVHSYE